MKYIVLLGLIIVAVFIYENKALSGAQIEVKSYGDVFTKLKYSPVSTNEIRVGSIDFATKLCEDTSFQEAAGKTTSACHYKLNNFKAACADRIFGEEQKLYSDKESVSLLSERFISCVTS